MGKALVWTLLVSVAIVPGIFREGSRSGFANPTSANVAAQTKKRITVPAGTRILIRMVDSIDTTKLTKGYRFTATLETNLQAEDTVVAPRGTTLYGHLAEASSAGRMSGSSELILELTDIVINGTAYPLLTSTYEVKGKGEGGNTAKKAVGGAGLGALIGGIAGGGKGAGIGALPVPLLELRLRVPRKDSSCKSPAKLCSNSAFSNPCRCPSLDSQSLA